MVACLGLRRKLPDLKRPFKVRGMVPGAVISIVIYLVMMTQLDTDALVTGVIYCVVGLVIYAVCAKVYGTRAIDVNAVQDTSEPTPAERAKMDREFHIWIAAAAIGCAGGPALPAAQPAGIGQRIHGTAIADAPRKTPRNRQRPVGLPHAGQRAILQRRAYRRHPFP